MAGEEGALLGQLKDLVNQIEGGCCGPCPAPCGPCEQCPAVFCPPTTRPIATCCMVSPPPILAPTVPQPVKPLQLPCPVGGGRREMSQEEAERTRYANYYNNYNIDWHPDPCSKPPYVENRKNKCKGVTTFGKSPCCEDYLKKPKNNPDEGCPTGFKPCTMKMTPPPGCHPCGVWCAEIQPCPPKSKKKVSAFYVPEPCTRPCCKHWKPKDGNCKYDRPCKAHCYNSPVEMKAKHHTF